MAKKKVGLIGAWAFLAGVIIAVIVGALGVSTATGTWAIVLLVIGLIVGLLNVGDKETNTFLLAALSLVIVSYFGGSSLAAIEIVGEILRALLVLFVPATIVVALKTLFVVSRN